MFWLILIVLIIGVGGWLASYAREQKNTPIYPPPSSPSAENDLTEEEIEYDYLQREEEREEEEEQWYFEQMEREEEEDD